MKQMISRKASVGLLSIASAVGVAPASGQTAKAEPRPPEAHQDVHPALLPCVTSAIRPRLERDFEPISFPTVTVAEEERARVFPRLWNNEGQVPPVELGTSTNPLTFRYSDILAPRLIGRRRSSLFEREQDNFSKTSFLSRDRLANLEQASETERTRHVREALRNLETAACKPQFQHADPRRPAAGSAPSAAPADAPSPDASPPGKLKGEPRASNTQQAEKNTPELVGSKITPVESPTARHDSLSWESLEELMSERPYSDGVPYVNMSPSPADYERLSREGRVELCTRPADLPINVGGIIPHDWIKVPGLEAGLGPEGGGVPGEGMRLQDKLPYVTMTSVISHEGQSELSGASCEPVPGLNEHCVREALAPGVPQGRWTLMNTCITFARRVIDACRVPKELNKSSSE